MLFNKLRSALAGRPVFTLRGLRDLRADRRGTLFFEYALILFVVALTIIPAATVIGGGLGNLFHHLAGSLVTAGASPDSQANRIDPPDRREARPAREKGGPAASG